jgi:hypothetical protein
MTNSFKASPPRLASVTEAQRGKIFRNNAWCARISMSGSTLETHPSSRELEQYVDGHLPEAEVSSVRTHLEGCEECQLRLADIALDNRWTGPERRSEPRVPVKYPGRLKLLDPVTSVGPPHDVEVIEISRGGLKIRTPRYLIPKTLIQIRFNGKSVLGEVRYCIKAEPQYYAGLRLVEDFPSE